MKLPADKTQIPDIFISLYTTGFMGEKKVGYLRLPVSNETISNADPKWYHLRSVENQADSSPYAFALLNIQFKLDNKSAGARIPKRRNIKAKYYFIAFVYAAYDLAPGLYGEEIEPQLEIRIPPEKPFVPKNNNQKGKNPVWNEFLHRDIELDENLEFAPNLVVTVTNKLNSGEKVGEFSIPAVECKTIKNYNDYLLEPKLFMLKKEGEPSGRIMAHFTLVKNPKKIDKDFFKRNKIKKIKADIEFSLIGIRNLIPAFKNPVIRLKVAGIDQVQEIKLDKEKFPDTDEFSNPNFLRFIKFTNIDLTHEALYLPPLEVELTDEDAFISKKYICNISLIERAVWIKSQRVLEVLNMFGGVTGAAVKVNKSKSNKSDLIAKNINKLDDASSQAGNDVNITISLIL